MWKFNIFGCKKKIDLELKCEREFFVLYKDKDCKNEFIRIRFKDFICVNRRQIERHETHTFSIFYKEWDKVKELRLNTLTRSQIEKWKTNLNKYVRPYEFPLKENLIHFKQKFKAIYQVKPNIFFEKLKNIEFIINTKFKYEFFAKFEKDYKHKKQISEYCSFSENRSLSCESNTGVLVTEESGPDYVHNTIHK